MDKEQSLIEFLNDYVKKHGENASAAKAIASLPDFIRENITGITPESIKRSWGNPEHVIGRDVTPVTRLSELRGTGDLLRRPSPFIGYLNKMIEDNKIRTVKDLQQMLKKGETNLIDYQENHGQGLLKNVRNPFVPGGEQTKFRQYPDEPLSPRISAVRMESHRQEDKTGTLHVTIDGKERMFLIGDHTFEGYKSGAVPINVLANVCMKEYDKQQTMLSSMAEMELERGRDQSQGRGQTMR